MAAQRPLTKAIQRVSALGKDVFQMVAVVALLLILAVFGGLGFAVHILWFVLIAALILWLVGFFVGGVERGVGGRRRWYGRW